MALNTFKYINVYYNKGDKKPYDVNGKPIAYLGQDFVGANEATIIRFYIGSDTGVINAVADVKRPDGEKAFALLDKVNTTEGVAWEFALTDWFCAKAGKLTIAFKAFNGVVTVIDNTIQSNNLRIIVSDIFNIDIGYAPNSVEDAPPFDPNDVATFVNALSGKLDKVSGINVVEALPTTTDGSLNGRWYLLKSGGETVFPYIEFTGNITFSATAPTGATIGDYWYNTTTNVLNEALGSMTWVPVTSTNGTITPAFGNSAGLNFVNTTSSKLFVTQSLTYKDIGRLYVFNFNTPVEVELGVETLKLKSTGNGEVTADTAKLSWNQPNGTVNVGLYNDVNVGVGEDVIYYVKATGAITKGDVIQYAGFQGDHALAKRAVQSEINANPKLIMGIAKQNIANGDFGYVAHFGKLEGVDTKSQAVNSFVWFDSAGSTAGNWTTTQPTAPNAKILLAVIIKAESSAEANNGVLLVRPTIEPKVSELQDVLITSVANGNVLSYDGTKWVNSTRLTTAESNITNLQGRMTTEEANVDNLQGRMTSAEGDIYDIESGATIVPRALGDQNGNTINTTYLTQSSASATYIPLSQKAQANGVATLGADGRVIPSQIPGIVSSVEEYDTLEDFPEVGVLTTVYLALDTGLTYLWSGSGYVALSSSLALGETSTTAYRGDRGKIAYDYSQVGHLPLAGGTITNDLTVNGNLTISGTTTTINTETVGIKDNLILINSNQTGTPSTALKGGLEIERGDLTNFQFVFDESDDRFKVGQVGSLQTVATRTDDGTIANRGITFFNTSTNRLENNANIVIDSSNRVGIGIATPTSLLEVSTGDIKLSTSAGTNANLRSLIFKNTNSTGFDIANIRSLTGDNIFEGILAFDTKNSSGTMVERMRILSNGNVGIGTTSPSNKLNIVLGAGANAPTSISKANAYLGLGQTEFNTNSYRMIGFGYSSTGNSHFPAYIGYQETSNSGETLGDLIFHTRNVTTDTLPSERMRITSAGNVGIGTASPDTKLELFGTDAGIIVHNSGNSRGGLFALNTSRIGLATTNTNDDLVFGYSSGYPLSTANFVERMRIDNGTGNVGIGTTSLEAKLHIASSETASRIVIQNTNNSSAGAGIFMKTTNAGTMVSNATLRTTNNGVFSIFTGTTTEIERLTINSSGDVNIGTTSANGKLNVFGTGSTGGAALSINPNSSSITALDIVVGANNTSQNGLYVYSTSNNQFNAFIRSNGNLENRNNSYGGISDIKLKENITDAKPKLNDLNKVRIVNFNFKNEETKQLGVIAQELQEIFPGMVEETEDKDRQGKLLGTTTKSVKYSVFVPMLIKAVQELKEQLDELKAKVG
jgi:hypothetical protein